MEEACGVDKGPYLMIPVPERNLLRQREPRPDNRSPYSSVSITDTNTQLLWEAGGGEGWPFLISAVEFLSLLSQILQDCKSGAWRT